MRYKVKVANRQFDVEIINLHTRPIIAFVDGEAIEVWPDHEETAQPGPEKFTPSASSTNGATKLVRAPIPGVIVSLTVKPGSEVKPGDELCLLEAMKMKNSIRASRSGRISAIHIAVGQNVKHNDVLMEFED